MTQDVNPHSLKPGMKLRFMNANGYDNERRQAAQVFQPDVWYRLDSVSIGGWSTTLSFLGVPGRWNSVMFTDQPEVRE